MNDYLSILIPAFPLAAAILTPILGPRLLRSRCHLLVIFAFLASFVCSVMLVADVAGHAGSAGPGGFEHTVPLWTWANVPEALAGSDFKIDITLRADALTAMMLAMVTFISTLVAVFSVGYMHGDRGYWRFFTYIGLFVFSMTMLVSVSNFVLLYVFWEAVGVCSYLLIGFWYEKPAAAAAGKKAFLVNRIGDFGFALALFLIWTTYGSLNFHDTVTEAGTTVAGVLGETNLASPSNYDGGTAGLAICLLLLLGACGKSAQFPLHVWLPDAMEGPTPVSALIHAATMVTAGVYMVARCTPLFMASPEAQLTVSGVGAFTAVLAGLIALTQFDLKRVLAYSTVSQLGFMFLALGTGTWAGITAGMFHLFTHAFFKALLFLGAGSVMYAMGHVIDMRRFSGLRRRMPDTHFAFFVGSLALAGILPFSGFWSKDAVLASVHDKANRLVQEAVQQEVHEAEDKSPDGTDDTNVVSSATLYSRAFSYKALFYAAMFAAFLTSFYTFRALFMTFYGESQYPAEAGDAPHEPPDAMVAPLVVLAICAVFVGAICELPPHVFAGFLESTPSLAYDTIRATPAPGHFHADIAAASTLIAFGGLFIAAYLYLGEKTELNRVTAVMKLQGIHRLFTNEAVEWIRNLTWIRSAEKCLRAVLPARCVAAIGYVLGIPLLILSVPLMFGLYISPYRISLGKFFIDEFYNLTIVYPLRVWARFCYAFDRYVVDGCVNLIGRLPSMLGAFLRPAQNGLIQFYALVIVVGVVVLVAAKVLWASW